MDASNIKYSTNKSDVSVYAKKCFFFSCSANAIYRTSQLLFLVKNAQPDLCWVRQLFRPKAWSQVRKSVFSCLGEIRSIRENHEIRSFVLWGRFMEQFKCYFLFLILIVHGIIIFFLFCARMLSWILKERRANLLLSPFLNHTVFLTWT